MTNEDTFAAIITGAILRASDEDIQAYVLEDLLKMTTGSKDLETTITEMRSMDRRPGDFGIEIAGTLLLPVLIEAAKQLWEAYVKRLSEKAGEALADYTIDGIKAVAKRTWNGEETFISVNEFEALVIQVAEKEGLSQKQTNGIIEALHSTRVNDELEMS